MKGIAEVALGAAVGIVLISAAVAPAEFILGAIMLAVGVLAVAAKTAMRPSVLGTAMGIGAMATVLNHPVYGWMMAEETTLWLAAVVAGAGLAVYFTMVMVAGQRLANHGAMADH